MSAIGEITALLTAGCWAISALAFEGAGARIGSLAVNVIRLFLGLAALTMFGLAVRGQPLPLDAGTHEWGWLAASAVAGLVVGDLCLFRAFVVLGPRLSSLIMSTSPVFTAIFGFVGLGETLGLADIGGMTAVSLGVAWALWSRGNPGRRPAPPPTTGGVALAFGGSLGQAGGLVLGKHGMGDYDAFAATQIRVIAAIAVFVVLFSILGLWRRVIAGLRNRRALAYTTIGAIFGPFLGVSLSLYAVQHTDAGVAAALMATTPILILPMVMARGEGVPVGGIAGAAVTVAGVALLFL